MNKLHIKLTGKEQVWFTSDLHLGHKNVLTFCNRPFKTVQEMSAGLIQAWNENVNDDDIVFILGDVFWFNNSQEIKKFFKSVKGKHIYIVEGNHDDFEGYHRVDPSRVHILSSEVTVWISEPWKDIKELYLSHCPMLTWPHRPSGVPNLFGHIHSGPGKEGTVDLDLNFWEGLQYDVGVDNNDYKPITLQTIYQKLGKKF